MVLYVNCSTAAAFSQCGLTAARACANITAAVAQAQAQLQPVLIRIAPGSCPDVNIRVKNMKLTLAASDSGLVRLNLRGKSQQMQRAFIVTNSTFSLLDFDMFGGAANAASELGPLGGTIYAADSAVSVVRSRFRNSTVQGAGRGGALFVTRTTSVTIMESEFFGNQIISTQTSASEIAGGALCVDGSSQAVVHISNVRFLFNRIVSTTVSKLIRGGAARIDMPRGFATYLACSHGIPSRFGREPR